MSLAQPNPDGGSTSLTTALLDKNVTDSASGGGGSGGQDERRKRQYWRSYFAVSVFLHRCRPEAQLPRAAHHVVHIPVAEFYRDLVARIVRDKALNSLQALGGVDDILPRLRSHCEVGDPPAWDRVQGKGFPYFLGKACNKYAIFILLGLAILSFVIESWEQGVKYGWHNGVAILLAVFAIVAFPSVRNYLLERKQLRDKIQLEVTVERMSGSSEEHTEITKSVPISSVVVGDVVHLKKGECVPADGLFIDGVDFVLDEKLNPKINREQNPFVLSGSKVIEGHGRIVVTSVGAKTAMAQWMKLVTHNPNEGTLLQVWMDKQFVFMDYLTLGGAILIALIMLIRELCFTKQDNYNDRPALKGEVSMSFLMRVVEKLFLKPQGRIPTLASALVAAVIGIQHGMPLAITLALGKWNAKMIQNHAADPQNLSACVTLGRVTALCIGTTDNQMELMKVFWMAGKDVASNVEGVSETNQDVLEALHRGVSAAPPTRDLLISWLKTRWGNGMELWHQDFEILVQRELISNEKCSRLLMKRIENEEQIFEWHYNGDASTILDMCSHYLDTSGESHVMENQMGILKEMVKNLVEIGFRPLAYAYKKTEAPQEEPTQNGLSLLTLVGLRRPYQEDLKLVVETFINSGRTVKLVSEGDLSAVRDRALELGIITAGSNDMELEGEAFRRLNSMERRDKVDSIPVMGNFLPRDKVLMVAGLKKIGHVVGFYAGLTISDTPTLKEADVGITEDIWSTEMARESADIIIRDGCLLTPNLKFGACAYHNIQKFCQLQLTACISGLLITLVATMHSGESPLTAVHLIWVNLIMCLLGGLMMVMEFEGTKLLTQRPPSRTESFLTKEIWKSIAIQVSYQASVLLLLHFIGNVVPSMDEGVSSSMIFNAFTLCQICNLFSAMDLVKKEVLKVVLGSYSFFMALGTVLVMQAVIVEFGQGLASAVKLNAVQWEICCLLAAFSWGLHLVIKLLSAGLTTCSSAFMLVVNSLKGLSVLRLKA